MPIEYPEPIAPMLVCGSCESRAEMAYLEAYDDEEEEPPAVEGLEDGADFRLPDGWVKLTLERVVPNPVWREEAEAFEQTRSYILEHERDPMRRAEVEQQTFDTDTAPLALQRCEEALCPKCSGALQTKLGFDTWPEVGT